jgi:DNA-binding SARP family transcriptional activator
MAERIDAFKVTPPTLSGAIDRPRLVAALCAIDTPALWLAGPSGAGKSTLAVQLVRATRKRLCWYRLDARDEDPAYFYAQWPGAPAGRGPRARTRATPRPGPEDIADESGFAQRYFAAAGGKGVPATAFVFDDMHTIASPQRLRALALFARSLHSGHQAIFIGQDPPPAEFFDVIAARTLALFDGSLLAFDDDECELLAQRSRLSGRSGTELVSLTGGHAAALVLVCEFLRSTRASGDDTARVVGRIHSHLFERLLERLPAERKALLVKTAFAPQFDAALAAALAGDDAASTIDALVRQGMLRRQSSDHGERYEAHALIRQGARAALRGEDGGEALRTHALRTAELLDVHGAPDQAFDLFVEFGDTVRAAQVLEKLAPHHARSGEAGLLLRSVAALPDPVLERHPWLCFWTGRSLQGIDEERARGWFERSHAGFAAANDAAGKRIAAASVVTAFVLEYGDIRTLEAWLARHIEAGGEQPVEPGCAHEATLCMGVVSAALNAGAYPATINADALVRRLQSLLDDPAAWLNRDHAVEAARLLVDHACVFGSREQAQNTVLATRRHSEVPHAGALQRGRWCLSSAYAYLADGRHDVANRYLDEARAIAAESDSHRLAFDLAQHDVNAAQSRGDVAAAMDHLARLEAVAAKGPPAQQAKFARLSARLKLAQQQYVEGLRWAEHALVLARQAGYEGASAREFELERIFGLAANERFDEAARYARAMASTLQGAQFVFADAIAHCLAFLATGGADPQALRKGLQQAESAGYVYMLARAGGTLACLCDSALRQGIHVDFVHRLIQTNRLLPPPGASADWPWPVRIRTLGSFSVEVAGEAYRPSRKAQDKPLELLKLLVCCQAMRRHSIDKPWLAQRLWADADEANARKSLDMTISRLRKLLRDDDAIVSQESRLALATDRVWTDLVPLLEAQARVSEARDRRNAGEHRQGATSSAVAALLEHFKGPFLPEDEGPPWVIAGREAVAAIVRSTLLGASEADETIDDPKLAAALERAFSADPTAEDLARALMRALIRSGQHAEALRVYRRLREMLSVVLSVAPTRETEQLREQIHADATAGIASAAVAPR